jgi:Arc/MetJ-type ribon-helix-helix transcriptional regulator
LFLTVKTYIHARLPPADRAMLEELRALTGRSESDLVRRGLRLVARQERRRRSALAAAGRSVGRFADGPRDLSTNRRHLEGFGG